MVCAEKAVLSNIRYSVFLLYAVVAEISDAQQLNVA